MSPTASSSASPPCSTEVAMLSADQCRSLRCLAEMMIPANTEYGVPSAGDEAIFGDILQSLGRDAGPAIAVLQRLDTLVRRVVRRSRRATARCQWGLGIPDSDHPAMLLPRRPGHAVAGHGTEGALFPKGFEVEQGDWSLLDPARARPKLYRDASRRKLASRRDWHSPLTP